MAKKAVKLQIVDLGTHHIKAIKCDYADGQVTVNGASSIPVNSMTYDADPYLTEVAGVFGNMAPFLDRKTPVHFVVNESLARVGISYLNNLSKANLETSLEAELNKFVSSYAASSYEAAVTRTFKLREKSQGDTVQVVAANVHARSICLEQIGDVVRASKLTMGGVYPRLFAYQDLYQLAFGTSGVGVLIDVGFTSTEIVAFKDGMVVFHKILHMGGIDFFRNLAELERGGPRLDLPTLVMVLSTSGFNESDEVISGMGLPIKDPSKWASTIMTTADQLFTKVQLAIDYFSTVAATDFNTSMSTVMAVRKGPEQVAITGTMATCPGFLELANQYFNKTCVVLDPAGIANIGSLKADLPPASFALCVGAAALVGSGRDPGHNLMTDAPAAAAAPVSSSSASLSYSGTGGEEPFVPAWASLLMIAFLLGLGGWWYWLEGEMKRLGNDLDSKQSQLDGAHDTIMKYRDVRIREALAGLQLEYIDKLLESRANWGQVLTDLSDCLPDGVKLIQITIDTTIPQSTNDPKNPFKVKEYKFVFCGEAKSRKLVGDFERQLKDKKKFEPTGSPTIQVAGQGAENGQPVCQPREADNMKHETHYSFQLSGVLRY